MIWPLQNVKGTLPDGARDTQVLDWTGGEIDNALKNTPPNGKVTLSLPIADARVIVRIEETGWGLSKEDLSQVKQRLFRTIGSKAAVSRAA